MEGQGWGLNVPRAPLTVTAYLPFESGAPPIMRLVAAVDEERVAGGPGLVMGGAREWRPTSACG